MSHLGGSFGILCVYWTTKNYDMTKISELIQQIESIAPLCYQESYDNAGLIVGQADQEIKAVLCSLDTIEATIDEAIGLGANLIVSHHPIIFGGLSKINGANYVERTVIKAIKNDIAIYAAHTNLDNVLHQGVNQKIGQKLGLEAMEILQPMAIAQEHIGAGILGILPTPMDEKAFLDLLKNRMQAKCIRHTELLGKPIRKVAICGGSGQFLLPTAIKNKADVFVSADFKYHQFFDADGHILIADIGHFESEQYTIELLFDIISTNFSNFATHYTKIDTNPVKYY